MGLETSTERKRKYIVEYLIGGFPTALRAIRFGNTCNALVEINIKPIKFRQWFAGMDTELAVTEDYEGLTKIKMTWLEMDRDAAHAVMKKVRSTMELHGKEYSDNLVVIEEIIRGKPLPQSINMNDTLRIAIGA